MKHLHHEEDPSAEVSIGLSSVAKGYNSERVDAAAVVGVKVRCTSDVDV
jgi:hypothetical protein